jgi:hypothetical protein
VQSFHNRLHNARIAATDYLPVNIYRVGSYLSTGGTLRESFKSPSSWCVCRSATSAFRGMIEMCRQHRLVVCPV